MTEVDAGGLPIFRAYPTNHEERFIREFILQLKLGHTNRGYFRKKYGEDPAERFADRFAELNAEGYLRLEGDEILISREGLLQIDRLLHGFFLPQHRDARYT